MVLLLFSRRIRAIERKAGVQPAEQTRHYIFSIAAEMWSGWATASGARANRLHRLRCSDRYVHQVKTIASSSELAVKAEFRLWKTARVDGNVFRSSFTKQLPVMPGKPPGSHYLALPQLGDLVLAEAELGKYLFGLLAEFRRARRHAAECAR